MKVLELFAGSKSIGKAAESLGMEVFSSDIEAFEGIDYVTDILKFDVDKVPFRPTLSGHHHHVRNGHWLVELRVVISTGRALERMVK